LPGNARVLDHVELAHEPDDRDDSYFACRPVDVSSLPEQIRGAIAKPLRLFLDDGTSCTERLKDVEACGWLMPKSTTLAARLSRLSEGSRAQKVFAEGAKFVAATIAGEGCHLARWASADDVRFWSVTTAADALKARAVAALQQLPEFSQRQGEYQRFKQLVRSTVTPGATAASRPALPEAWLDLGGDTASWLVTPAAGPQLIITYFKRRPDYNQLPTSLIQAPNTSGFCTALVSIWSIPKASSATLTSVGLEPPIRDCEAFQVVGAATNRPGLPMLLFEKPGTVGGLRFDGTRYVIDHVLAFGPGG
jgi:hypothetical protein